MFTEKEVDKMLKVLNSCVHEEQRFNARMWITKIIKQRKLNEKLRSKTGFSKSHARLLQGLEALEKLSEDEKRIHH